MDGEKYIAPDGKVYPVSVERTEQGMQFVFSGVAPQTMKDKVNFLMNLPMQPRRAQKPCDIGLFDTESRRQLEMF